MDTTVEIDKILHVDLHKNAKMVFLYNALENGWQIKKTNNKYIFTKKHEGKKEVYLDSYLRRFIEGNFDINKMINENI